MPETQTPSDAYNRGRADGMVSVRLDHHDDQLEGISATLAKVVSVEATLTLAMQELGGELKASRDTAKALALALSEAKEAQEAADRKEVVKAAAAAKERETKDALGWSPVTKVFAVATALSSGFIVVYALLRPGG